MNKNIFITGGTSAIGKSLIKKFAKKKYNIFFTYYNNSKEAKIISAELIKLNICHNYAKMDLNSTKSINEAFNKFSKNFKEVSVFINNASIEVKRNIFLNIKPHDISKNINGFLVGTIFVIIRALKIILKKKLKNKSTIINISSYSSISGGRDIHLYAASKSAMNTLMLALYNDYLKKKIKIISVVPRHIDTPAFRKNNKINNNSELIKFQKRKKIKKIKTPTEFADFIYNTVVEKKNKMIKPIIYYDSF